MSEYLYIVDKNNNPLPTKSTRAQTHNKSFWHRTSHVWVLDSKNRLLVVKRGSWKNHDPGKWASYVGGHFLWKENKYEAATREIKEELNLNITKSRLNLLFVRKNNGAKGLVDPPE